MSAETRSPQEALEDIEAAVERLDSACHSLVNLTSLPASIHVEALRGLLPELLQEFRTALRKARGEA